MSLTKDSLASTSTVVGFLIEADQMEGTMQPAVMTAGDSADVQGLSMLALKFDHLTAEGLKIKKIVSTSNGFITINMEAKQAALFNNLTVNATNAAFTETFNPGTGNIGFKNIKILAHYISADQNTLPQFQFSFDNGQSDLGLTPKEEPELIQMAVYLNSLIAP